MRSARASKSKQTHQHKSSSLPKQMVRAPAPVHPILQLQRTIGNQGVLRLVESGQLGVIQKEPNATSEAPAQLQDVGEAENRTGLPRRLKAGLESLSGMDLSGVRVHKNSSNPDQLSASAYTQGKDIHVGPGQEKHLPHEGWHAVQQMQGRVKPTMQAKGVSINDDAGLEREADVMGAKALQMAQADQTTTGSDLPGATSLQQEIETKGESWAPDEATGEGGEKSRLNFLSTVGKRETPLQKKGKKKISKAAQVKGTYSIKKLKAGGYVYTFNSKDLLASKNPWDLVVGRHFRNIFPTAPAGAEKSVLNSITDRRFSRDLNEEAGKADTTRIQIDTSVHKAILSTMKVRYPTVPSAVPVEATHGLDEDKGGQASQTTTPQPAAPTQPGTVAPVKGQVIHLPANLKPDDKGKILKTLNEILVGPDPSQKPDKPPSDLFISPKGVELLLQIANDPALLARLKSAGSAKGDGPDFEQSLEIAIANESMAQARKRLKLEEPSGSRLEDPIVNRPVHGEIKNLTGYLVPNQEARFTFEVQDDRDAFRVPMISIHWYAYPTGEPGKLVDDEVTNYIPVRSQGILNDRIFNVTFDKPGKYQIEAFVQHNFFEPAWFPLKNGVRVVTETALAEELNKEELTGFAADQGTTTPHLYKIGGLQGLQMGTKTRGKLDPKATILTIEARLQTVADEKKLIKVLIENYKGQQTNEAKQIVKWAENYLKTLKESKRSLKKDKGGVPLGVRGVFISRQTDYPTKPLTLLCYFFKTSDGYLLILRDFTQLFEQEDYRFKAKDKTVEKSEEKAFLKQADAYPFGTLSVTFQAFDETTHIPTDQFVRFEKITDTPEKKFEKFIFGTAMDIGVNLLAAVLMIVPGLQVLGIALAIAYNTAKTVSELEDAANKGTLTSGKIGIGLAQITLNILPLAGRGAKLMTIAGKTFYVMEAVNVAGNILLVSQQGMNAVDKLRSGVIKELAVVDEKIRHLEKNNMADPSLPDLKKRRGELIKEGEDATVKVFADLLKEQALMMVGQHLVMGYVSRRLSVGQLKSEGTFRHEKDAKARYDFKEGKIVGDELKILPAELERLQMQNGQNKALEGVIADPAQRQKVVEAFGDHTVEVKTGVAKTGLKQEGGKSILEVADGANPADILRAAQKAKDLPKSPPKQKKPPAPPKKGEAAPEDTFKPVEPQKKKVIVEKEPTAEAPLDAQALEAQAEHALTVDAQAKAAYAAAKKKGFQKKTAKSKQLTEQDFVDKYENGKVFNPETSRFYTVEPGAKLPPEPFPAGTNTDMILERLTGKESTSSFKKYSEMLKRQKLADEAGLRAAIDEVRKRYNLDTEAASVDTVRHALKEKFRSKVVKSMFEASDGTKLDPKASHKKMLEATEQLNSADKGTLTEEWVQKTRQAAGVKEVPQKVKVKKADHPRMTQDRQLDRIEGDAINEIKSTDSYLSKRDKAEIADHLKLIGTEGTTIDVRGNPQIIKKEKLTFTHPEGARKNADYIIEQLETFDTLSVEVFNNAGESKIFTKSGVTGVNAGKLHEFIGKKYRK